jgi:hypothetical protein
MVNGRRVAGLIVITLLLLVTFIAGWLAGRTGMGSVVDLASLSDAERQFAERMSGASLVGQFTIAGREAGGGGRPERYDLSSVEKVGDDRWRFNARIRYGSVDTTVPIVVPLRFVGDTPMIILTDFTIPTLGTFTTRVFFYEDRYAGTWQHGEFGGHMFGRIEKTGEAAAK